MIGGLGLASVLTLSMSGKGSCYDAMAETVFKTIKSELMWRTMFQTRNEAIRANGEYRGLL